MTNSIIEVRNLHKQYHHHRVINDVSFQVKKGSICGLIGPNGAGKTTIMKMLGGIVLPDAGEISLFGVTNKKEVEFARSRTSFIIESPYVIANMTARQNLEKQRIQRGIPDKNRVEEVLKLVGLHEVGNKKVKDYSLGMKQRLGIANALLPKPELMILDEPVNGLDPAGIVEMRELLMRLNQEEEVTILISSHILSELALMCTDYLFISKGEIVKSITDQELKNACRTYFGIHTDNDAMALAILQDQLQVENYVVKEDGSIKLFEYLDEPEVVSKTLYAHGVIPLQLYISGESLEEYYMSTAGGNVDVERDESPELSVSKK